MLPVMPPFASLRVTRPGVTPQSVTPQVLTARRHMHSCPDCASLASVRLTRRLAHSEPCTSFEDVQVISQPCTGARAPHDRRRVAPHLRSEEAKMAELHYMEMGWSGSGWMDPLPLEYPPAPAPAPVAPTPPASKPPAARPASPSPFG